jgi:hypothetical protein
MTEASLAIQAAVIQILNSAAGLPDGIYDKVPAGAAFPYITFTATIVNDDSAECITGSEVFFDIHVWSRAVGWPEAASIAGAIRAALDRIEIPLSGQRLIACNFLNFRRVDDPDGITRHGVVSFIALIDAD